MGWNGEREEGKRWSKQRSEKFLGFVAQTLTESQSLKWLNADSLLYFRALTLAGVWHSGWQRYRWVIDAIVSLSMEA